MGTIKATNIEPIADNGTVTLGSSGDTFSLGSGVKQSNLFYPAFEASLSSTQSVSNDTTVKIQINSEILDTDNCYDNSTNYRFTPTKAGKYFVYAKARGQSDNNDLLRDISVMIYKNGSLEIDHIFLFRNNYERTATPSVFGIVDMNGSSDYVELYGKITQPTGTPDGFIGGSRVTLFGAYRIGT